MHLHLHLLRHLHLFRHLHLHLHLLDIINPRLAIDENYTGEVPKLEVTMDNLNDNINLEFLSNKLAKFGEWDTLAIDFHPLTKKHLGLARVVFKVVSSATSCVSSLHGKSMMGKQVNCYLDPRGLMATKMFEDLTTEKQAEDEVEEEEVEEVEAEVEDDLPEADSLPWAGEEEGGREGSRRWEEGERYGGGERWEEETQTAWADREGGREGRGRRSRWDTVHEHEREGRRRGSREGSRGWEDSKSREEWGSHGSSRQEGRSGGTDWEAAARQWSLHQPEDEAPPPELGSLLGRLGGTDSETEGSRKLDLDTRLQLLMKDKSGSMPAFLIGSDSSEEEPAPPPPPALPPLPPPRPAASSSPPSPSLPLSRDPSPFLSHEAYLASFHLTHQQEELERVTAALALHPRGASRASDKMSLSPLSDGGREILEQQPAEPFPGQPGYWPGTQHFPSATYPQPWAPGPWGGGEGEGERWQYSVPAAPWANGKAEVVEEKPRERRKVKPGTNPYKYIIEGVIKIVEKELKDILKRDINKRVCATYAFVLYDNWWMGEEARHKERLEREAAVIANDNRISRAPTITVPDKAAVAELPRIPKPEDLTSLIDRRREHIESGSKSSFGAGGSLGLGFRGVIPKIRKVQQEKTVSPDHSPEPSGSKGEGARGRSPSKKERKKEKEERKKERKEEKKKTSPKKEEVKKSSSASVYKAIYSESDDSDGEKAKTEEEEEESSAVSTSAASGSSSSDSSSSDSDSDQESRSRSSSKSSTSSVSRSASPSTPAPRVPTPPSHAPSPPSTKPASPGTSRPGSPSTPSSVHSAPPTPTAPPSPRPAVSPRRSALARPSLAEDSGTDSAGEGAAPPATPQRAGAGSGTPVKVQHVVSSPPHIMDHCYARPAPRPTITLSDSDDDCVPTAPAGQFDHDYTTPRTPPAARPQPAPVQKHRAKQKPPPARPALPFKPVKYKPRLGPEQFKVIYKFLTEGVDLEDVMYLKRSYEMVSGCPSPFSRAAISQFLAFSVPIFSQ